MQTRTESVGRNISKQWIGTLLVAAFCIVFSQIAAAGIMAQSQITLYGSGVVDSYDSSDPYKSSNGQYDPARACSNAFVLSSGGPIFLDNTRVAGTIRPNAQIPFPIVRPPTNSGIAPSPGIVVSIATTNTTSATVVNGFNPPPAPGTNQAIVGTTNIVTVSSTVYPGNQPGLKTNYTVVVIATNRTVVLVASNLVCGTTNYASKSLPTNYCSYIIRGQPSGAYYYEFTLIVGTNLMYQTNLTYVYGTNATYTFLQSFYNYTIYTTNYIYQTNNYDHILCGAGYVADSLMGETYVACPSRLVLTNGFQMFGYDQITIAPGASLLLYVTGGDCLIQTLNILNQTGYPSNLVVYCANDVTNLELDGIFTFAAVVIAPNSQATINPSGTLPLDFSGFLMVKSLVVNGILNFHFDESLRSYAQLPNPVSPHHFASGAFSFQVIGASGTSYVVQASTNFIDWYPVTTNTGTFWFSDTNTDISDRKFYRVLWP